jgi:hypothetical protein
MVDVVWVPTWRQLIVTSLAHGAAIAGIALSSSWLPELRWLALPVLASWCFDVVTAKKAFGRRRHLRLSSGRLAIRDADEWRAVDIADPWLGPALVVLRVRDGKRRQRWWLWRDEIGSPADAALRRALLSDRAAVRGWGSTRDGL